MKREDIRKLLGGYATGTLTAEERQALFEAALDDQELFDALTKEQPLRDLLEDPAARARLLAALDDSPLPSLVGQAFLPANPLSRLRPLEQWLWGHAVGIAAVACFLTVGGYVAWQARDWRKPTLMAEMERQSVAAPDSAPQARRVFKPEAATKKPAPAAMVLPAPLPVPAPSRSAPVNLPVPRMAPLPPPPPVPAPSRSALVNLPVPRMAPLPPPPPPEARRVAESVEVTGALPLLETQTAPRPNQLLPTAGAWPATPSVTILYDSGAITGASLYRPDMPQTGAAAARPSGPSPAEPLPAYGRGAGGFVATRSVGAARDGLSSVRAPQGARELYDPALAPTVPKSESAPVQAGGGRGGGGGAAARPRGKTDTAPAATPALGNFNVNGGQTWQTAQYADGAPPAARLGVRYQVLRRAATGEYQEMAAGSDLAVGDTVKLRFIPNFRGYLCAALEANPAVLLQRRMEPFEAVETPGIEVSYAPARLEMYVLFTREDQPRVDNASPGPFFMKVRQAAGASGMLSEAAGMEGVYVVNLAPGAAGDVPFIIALNFK
jgi:hypothetical protein